MAKSNYRQIFARKRDSQDRIKKLFPCITNESGIYVFYRTDENGIKFAYVGQAKHLLDRCAQHLLTYQKIDLSIKKHGLYDEKKTPYGYKLWVTCCNENELDLKEREWIKTIADKGYQLKNATLGGQDKGKIVTDSKAPKGYHDGLKQGYENCRKEIIEFFDKYLDFSIKNCAESHKKDGSFKEIFVKKYQEFKEFLGDKIVQ